MPKKIDIENISIQGRAAIALLASEYVLPLFAANQATRDLLKEVIQSGWSWINQRIPDPSAMYHRYNPKLMEQETMFHDDPRLLDAFHCCLYAYHYLVWKAEGVASQEQPGVVYSIGNDIAEADESYLHECLERAVRVSRQPDKTEAWLTSLIEQIKKDFPVCGDDEIGEKPRREAFVVPPIKA